MSARTEASPKDRSLAKRSAVGLVLVAFTALAVPALADTAQDFPACTHDPTPADLEGAAGAHKAAKAYYERGEYDKAVDRWREAYSFDCTKPAVFLNLANAYERKGDRASTVAMLELYLTRAPKDAPDLATIATRVSNLKASIKNEPPPTPSASASAAPATTAAPTATPAGPTGPVGERRFGIAPWIVAGGGAALLVTGVILLPVGSGMESDAADQCPDRGKTSGCPQDVVDKGNSGILLQKLGGVFLGVGGAALAGGIVWQFVFNEPKAAPKAGRVTLTPTLAPKHAGAVVSGTF